MRKQKLAFSTLVLLTSLIGLPMGVNAGQTSIPGTTEESSSFSGDTFNPNPGVTSPQITPGLEATIGPDGKIRVPGEVQKNINCAFSSSDIEPEDLRNVILGLLSNRSDVAVQSQVKNYISSLGVSSELTSNLVSALSGMVDATAADKPGVPTSLLKVRSVQLVTDNGAEASPQCISNVDINKLNNAINAYNKIVQKSDHKVLKKLSKESNFILIGKVLKDLRIAMNRPSELQMKKS
jgi:hypothetical protein